MRLPLHPSQRLICKMHDNTSMDIRSCDLDYDTWLSHAISGSLLPRVRLATGDLSEITDKILAGSILWTSIPYGNFERACISLL